MLWELIYAFITRSSKLHSFLCLNFWVRCLMLVAQNWIALRELGIELQWYWAKYIWIHFDGLITKLLLKTFYDFLIRHLKNLKIHFFEIWKKRKIRILEHWALTENVLDHKVIKEREQVFFGVVFESKSKFQFQLGKSATVHVPILHSDYGSDKSHSTKSKPK